MFDIVVFIMLLLSPVLAIRLVWYWAKRKNWPISRIENTMVWFFLLTLAPVYWFLTRDLFVFMNITLNVFYRVIFIIFIFIASFLITIICFYDIDKNLRRSEWHLSEYLNYYLRNFVLGYLPLFILLLSGTGLLYVLERLKFISNLLLWLWGPVLIIILFVGYPQLVMSFMKGYPLSPGALHDKLMKLKNKTNVHFQDIYCIDYSKGKITDAWAVGIVPFNRKIFISKYILNNYSDEEIEAIVAHELGHLKYNHLLLNLFLAIGYMIFFGLVFHIVSFFISITIGISMITGMFCGLIWTIIHSTIKHRNEFQADAYAAQVIGNPQPLIQALSKLDNLDNKLKFDSAKSSIDIRGKLWKFLQTHPTIEDRIKRLSFRF